MQEVSGSIPLSSTKFRTQRNWRVKAYCGAIAQLGERLHGMQEVSGSIPLSSTKIQTLAFTRGFLFLSSSFTQFFLLYLNKHTSGKATVMRGIRAADSLIRSMNKSIISVNLF